MMKFAGCNHAGLSMCAPYRTIQVIINPAAGGKALPPGALAAMFEPHGLRWTATVTRQPGDARHLAQAAADAGADLVAVYGGDGTLAQAASGLIGRDIPLAILPGGTANILAAELNIPRRLRDAAALIVRPGSVPRVIDMGCIEDRFFLVRASAGYEAAVIHRSRQPLKNRLGAFGYGIAALRAVGGLRPARYHLGVDDRHVTLSGGCIFIANARQIGRLGLVLASSIRSDDGLLDVIAVRYTPRSLIALAASAARLDGLASALPHWTARSITLEADPPQPVQVDGEACGQTPVTVTILPQAVRILTPGGAR